MDIRSFFGGKHAPKKGAASTPASASRPHPTPAKPRGPEKEEGGDGSAQGARPLTSTAKVDRKRAQEAPAVVDLDGDDDVLEMCAQHLGLRPLQHSAPERTCTKDTTPGGEGGWWSPEEDFQESVAKSPKGRTGDAAADTRRSPRQSDVKSGNRDGGKREAKRDAVATPSRVAAGPTAGRGEPAPRSGDKRDRSTASEKATPTKAPRGGRAGGGEYTGSGRKQGLQGPSRAKAAAALEDDDGVNKGEDVRANANVVPPKHKAGTAMQRGGKGDDKSAGQKPAAATPASRPSVPPEGVARSPGPAKAGVRGCLRGCTFVLTGEFVRLGTREQAEDFVREWGGRVTAKVSGQTTYLLRGHDYGDPSAMQTGTKVTDAGVRGTPILGEEDLIGLVEKSAEGVVPDRIRDAQRRAQEAEARASKAAAKRALASPLSPPTLGAASGGKRPAAAPSGGGGSGEGQGSALGGREPSTLWTDVYAPRSLDELIGNQGAAKKLQEWLRTFGKPGAPKAALLSGPPGVGKTTAAKLVTRLEGFDAVEFNASDVRSKAAVRHYALDMADNRTLLEFGTGNVGGVELGAPGAPGSIPAASASASASVSGASKGKAGGVGGGKRTLPTPPPPRRLSQLCIIMDEVDGMGGGDRGGMQELIHVIKNTRIPVVCICNDRQDQKVRSLANYCLDIRFTRAPPAAAAKRLMAIAEREGVPMEPEALERVVQTSRSDIRQVLNVLQMWRPAAGASSPSKRLGFSEVKGRLQTADKDVTQGVFDVAPKFFSVGDTSVEDRLRLFFADDLVPLFVEENYLSSRPARCPAGNEVAHLNMIAMAANSIAEGDVVGTAIMRQQRWELAPFHGIMSAVVPGFIMQGGLPGSSARFPTWLGRNSTANKNQRLARDLHAHMMPHTSAGKLQTLLTYLPALEKALTTPLLRRQADGIDDVVSVMLEYSLDKTDYEAVLSFLDLLAPKGTDGAALEERTVLPSKAFDALDKSVKAAFTKRYNERRPGETHRVGKSVKIGVEGGQGVAGGDVDGNDDAPAKDEARAVLGADGDEDADENGDGDDFKSDRLVKAKAKGHKAAAPTAGESAAAGRKSGSGKRGAATADRKGGGSKRSKK